MRMTLLISQFKAMVPSAKSFCMWAVSVPLTWKGVDGFLHGATSVLGFLTSVTGLVIGTLGVVYWARKIKRQR